MAKIFIPINKLEDWRSLLADPEKQWKSEFSAKALAYCWIEADDFPMSIKKAFSNSDNGPFKEIEILCAFPEYSNELGLDEADVQEIRYQLLHRTASAIIEAKRFNASKAMMLVHSFSQQHEWFDDYSSFASLFGIEAILGKVHFVKKINDVDLHLAWITGEKKYLSK